MTLQLYIFRQLGMAIAFAVGGMAFIAVPGIVVGAVQKLGSVGLQAIFGYLPMVAVELVPYLVPIGFLLALVATYGRLAADNEWTAICMAGMHPLRVLLVPILFAALFGVGTWWLAANVSPRLKLAQRSYLKQSMVGAFQNLAPGRTELRIGRFYISGRLRVDDTFYDVLIHVPGGDDGGERTLVADEARFEVEAGKTLTIAMHNARTVKGNIDFQSEHPTVRVNLEKLFPADRSKRIAGKYMTNGEIRESLRSGVYADNPALVSQLHFHVHERLALGFVYFMFLALGVPTGILLRRGTQLGALASAVGYALAYYVLSVRAPRLLMDLEAVSPAVAAWFPSSIGFLVGAVLCRRGLWR